MDNDGILLNFPLGLVGFPEYVRLRLFEPLDAYPLKFLQCEDKPEISFVALDVAGIRPDYRVPLSDEEAEMLALEKEADALVLTLVIIPPDDPRRMTTNLAGPLIINIKTLVGRQIALFGEKYPLQHYVLGEP
jgi:flagellar assembly factor FliW